jgi:predicted phosphodiesterase
VYSNPYALHAFVADARSRGAQRFYCLGDLGGYGAEPDAVWPLLQRHDIICVAGNYDVAIASGGEDCGCGYRDPQDRHYAQIMYDYTRANTSTAFAAWMGDLPTERRETIDGCDVHFVHGSPMALNDFWWESLSDEAHQARVGVSGAEVIFATHSGLPWVRRTASSVTVNVGVLGRPANDGSTEVCYALVDLAAGHADAEIVRIAYDWAGHAGSMRAAGLPEVFVRTVETGWWTSCLEILPYRERSRGRYHVYDSGAPELLAAAGLGACLWPDDDPGIPVRSLVGSPLLPARIWVDDGSLTPEVASAAAAVGIDEVRVRGRDPLPPGGTLAPGVPTPELTFADRGWHWHPDHIDAQPLVAVPAPTGSAARRSVADALAATVYELLRQLDAGGALSPPRYCVA